MLAVCVFLLLAFSVQRRLARFRAIHLGMSTSQVESIVGLPQRASTNDGVIRWFYNTEWPGRGGTTVFFYTNGVENVYTP